MERKERIKRFTKSEVLPTNIESYVRWKIYGFFEQGYKPEDVVHMLPNVSYDNAEAAYRYWLTKKGAI
jgi:hypothetical protein